VDDQIQMKQYKGAINLEIEEVDYTLFRNCDFVVTLGTGYSHSFIISSITFFSHCDFVVVALGTGYLHSFCHNLISRQHNVLNTFILTLLVSTLTVYDI